MLIAINWFVASQPFPEKVFDAPSSGLDWLRALHPEVEPESVLAAVAAAVPSFSALRW